MAKIDNYAKISQSSIIERLSWLVDVIYEIKKNKKFISFIRNEENKNYYVKNNVSLLKSLTQEQPSEIILSTPSVSEELYRCIIYLNKNDKSTIKQVSEEINQINRLSDVISDTPSVSEELSKRIIYLNKDNESLPIQVPQEMNKINSPMSVEQWKTLYESASAQNISMYLKQWTVYFSEYLYQCAASIFNPVFIAVNQLMESINFAWSHILHDTNKSLQGSIQTDDGCSLTLNLDFDSYLYARDLQQSQSLQLLTKKMTIHASWFHLGMRIIGVLIQALERVAVLGLPGSGWFTFIVALLKAGKDIHLLSQEGLDLPTISV